MHNEATNDTRAAVAALRDSHDRLSHLVAPLSVAQIDEPSYASEWSIAQVASHLGSQAEIFSLFLGAGLAGTPAPGGDEFGPIWERWNALPPTEQVSRSVAMNEAFVSRLESLDPTDQEQFALSLFGMDLDVAGLARMRLSEHAVHTWDIAVALDPDATLAADAVELLVDGLPGTVSHTAVAVPGVAPLRIETATPVRRFLLTVGDEVRLVAEAGAAPLDNESSADGPGDLLRLPAEALIRLVYGRLDPAHTPAGVTDDGRLAQVRALFPGF